MTSPAMQPAYSIATKILLLLAALCYEHAAAAVSEIHSTSGGVHAKGERREQEHAARSSGAVFVQSEAHGLAAREEVQSSQKAVAELHEQLAKAVRAQKVLRTRLSEVRHEAHNGLSLLRGELRRVKRSAAKREGELSAELARSGATSAKESQSLAKANSELRSLGKRVEALEESWNSLRVDLKSSKEAAARSASLLNQSRQETMQLKVQLNHTQREKLKSFAQVQELTSMRNSLSARLEAERHASEARSTELGRESQVQKSLRHEIAQQKQVIMRMSSELQSLETSQQQLKAELNATIQKGLELRSKLSAQLADATTKAGQANQRAEEQKRVNLELQANISKLVETAKSTARAAHLDHLSLLNQVSELQEDVQQAKESGAAAEKRMKEELDEADHKAAELQAQEHQHEEESRHTVLDLQEQVKAANADAFAVRANLTAASNMEGFLRQTVATKDQELRTALEEASTLKAARDAAVKDGESIKQKSSDTEVALEEEKIELSEAQKQFSDAHSKQTELAREVSETQQQRDELRAQNEKLRNASAQQQVEAQKQVHNVMLSAAAKVRDMEEKVDDLQSDLQKTKSSLADATEEAAKAKDTLVQETDAALRATQRADALSASLTSAQADVEKSRDQTSGLLSKVSALQAASTRATSALHKSEDLAADWEAKAEALQRSEAKEQRQAKDLKEENNNLQMQVEELMREHQRAEDLSSRLSTLQVAAQANTSHEQQLEDQVQRLRDLKDHYSSEYDSMHKESEGWRAKAEQLEHELLSAERSETAVARQRDAAVDRVRSARSEEDEYFEENTHMQQQVEELQAELHDAYAASNRSAAEDGALRGEVHDLRADMAQEKRSAHAAWVTNENELLQAKRDLLIARQAKEALQAEVSHMQAVLTDDQRKTLGVSPAGEGARSAPPAAPQHLPQRHSAAPAPRSHAMRAIRGAASLQQKSARASAAAGGAAPAARSAAAAAASTQSTLQKLAEYFASPIQR
mmetsp:Transcript_36940/g.94242  ORF Transcript_36940/g.94242 Transcript_36940/m.94242 type:complete len:990 (+) Transcript_36940:53-3022(+)